MSLRSEKDTHMLVSVLEEQFKTMETWLTPVHHEDADRIAYFKEIVDRFETMQNGYAKLVNALKAKYKPLEDRKRKKEQSKNKQNSKNTGKKSQKKKKSQQISLINKDVNKDD
jgi:hypothetical protein